MPGWIIPRTFYATADVSIIIAARNEEDHIAQCINSLLAQSYPSDKMEIIVVDDFSNDRTPEIVHQINNPKVKLISLKSLSPNFKGPAYKKKAIEQGIKKSAGQIILTTDADCTAPQHWVASMVSFMEAHNKDVITGPVRITYGAPLLQKFQSIEMLGMNAVTAVGINSKKILLSNGANLAYKKRLFTKLEGFKDIDQIASGDDVLFLQKVNQYNSALIGYCKSHQAFIDTQPMTTYSDLLHQRIRWASKYNHFKRSWIKPIMAAIFVYCLLQITLPVLGLIIDIKLLIGWAILMFFKARIDHWYLTNLSQEFDQVELNKSFISSFIIYPVQVIIVGTISIFKKNYIWKGRSVH